MSTQPSMFVTQPGADPWQNSAIVPAHPRDTTAKAAVAVLPRTGTQRRRVFDLLVDADKAGTPGWTDEGIARYLRLSLNSVRPRRKELLDAGLIEDSHERGQTEAGQACIRWRLSERGRETAKVAEGAVA